MAAAVGGIAWLYFSNSSGGIPAHAQPQAPPEVVVSRPLERELDTQLGFLGQFSAVDRVELRAQVGGTLTEIRFKDGDIVQKGELLFVIDPVPYEIKLAEATAQMENATARLDLANRELARAQMLKRNGVVSVENLDQRTSDQEAAQAALDDAQAQIRDARSIWTIAASSPLSPVGLAATWSPLATWLPAAGPPAAQRPCLRQWCRSTQSIWIST
jgi:membrane fusion protein, multidrug efflux system